MTTEISVKCLVYSIDQISNEIRKYLAASKYILINCDVQLTFMGIIYHVGFASDVMNWENE